MLSDQYPEFLNTEDRKGNPIEPPTINWREKINWNDPDIQMAMQDMYLPENERFFGKKEIDTRKLIYEFWWIDLQQAANAPTATTSKPNGTKEMFTMPVRTGTHRKPFIIHPQR
jgi:hypothetical protein